MYRLVVSSCMTYGFIVLPCCRVGYLDMSCHFSCNVYSCVVHGLDEHYFIVYRLSFYHVT